MRRQLYAALFLTSIFAFVGCEKPSTPGVRASTNQPCLPAGSPYLRGITRAVNEFEDLMIVAGASGRLALPPQLNRLLDVRRRVRELAAPACAVRFQEQLAAAMEARIGVLLHFVTMSDRDQDLWKYMTDADKGNYLGQPKAQENWKAAMDEFERLKRESPRQAATPTPVP